MSSRSRSTKWSAAGEPYSLLPIDLDVEVALGRVDVLPRSSKTTAATSDPGGGDDQLADRGANRRGVDPSGPTRVPDNRRRRQRALADRVRDHVEPCTPSRSWGMPLFDPGPSSSAKTGRQVPEGAPRCRRRRRPGGAGSPRQPHPEVVLGVTALEDPIGDEPDPIELRAEEVEEHGQERQRADDGHDRDREAADPEAAHERQRHEEHQRKADPHSRTTKTTARPAVSIVRTIAASLS